MDRYGEVLVVQVGTAGMERLETELIAALVELLSPAGILLRNDASVREMEQLPLYSRVAFGEVPEYLELRENGASFRVSATGGQKTGWFYDHRMNRRRVAELARGQRVLDVFSYVGGWGGPCEVAQAIWKVRQTRSPAELQRFLGKLRIFMIGLGNKPVQANDKIKAKSNQTGMEN